MFGYWNDYYYIAIPFQILAIIHALKTGRRQWLYLLIFIPIIGTVIYFFSELLPEISSGTFFSNLQKYFFPNQKIREWERKVQISDNITNKLGLSNAYAEQKHYEKAIGLSLSCLKGLYSDDPAILLQLARQYFYNEQYAESLAYFDQLNLKNGHRFNMSEDELLYVRAEEGAGRYESAENGYQRIIRIHHSLEARYYYGLFLKKQQRNAEAREQFQAIRDEIKLLPRYLRRRSATWSRRALRELMSTKS